jgi:hypothetical protein
MLLSGLGGVLSATFTDARNRRCASASLYCSSPLFLGALAMNNDPSWPTYPTGDRDSIFAMGVASINWVDLESTLHFMFGTIFELDLNSTTMIPAKMGAEASIMLMRQKLPDTDWSDDVKDSASYFISGLSICLANRNHLMHSNLSWLHRSGKMLLYKTSKQGKTLAAVPTLSELRQVADDIKAFATFGQMLANAINNSKFGTPVFSAAAFPWPDRPALPHSLDYSPDPRPI